MTVLEFAALFLVVLTGTGVVFTHDPRQQAIVLGFSGFAMATWLLLVLQAPDVALAQVTVGSVMLPGMTLVALAKAKDYAERGRLRGEEPDDE